MSVELKEKLERWLESIPEKCMPVQAAATALAMKRQIEGEGWEKENSKSAAMLYLDLVCFFLYQSHMYNMKGKADTKIFQKQFNMSSMLLGKVSDKDIVNKLNSLSTKGKREFLKRAEFLSRKINCSYSNLLDSIIGSQINTKAPNHIVFSVTSSLQEFGLILNSVEHPIFINHMRSILSPDDGPRSTKDLWLLSAAYIKGHNLLNKSIISVQGQTKIELANVAIIAFTNHIGKMQDDLPMERIANMLNEDLEVVKEVANSHSLSMRKIMGLIHFYLEHNEEKLQASDYAMLSNCLDEMNYGNIRDQVDNIQHHMTGVTPSELDDLVDKTVQRFFINYHKPSVDEVADLTIVSIKNHYSKRPKLLNRNMAAFEETRDLISEGMEEIVLLHYKESEAIRKIRKKSFGYKKKDFLREVAKTEEPSLLLLGFAKEEISEMEKTGEIPKNKKEEFNIEHIIDREHGGTNHEHNFILIPKEINEQKDTLKQSQINFIPDSEEGCWIISWQPKKNEDGTYPKVFIPVVNDNHYPYNDYEEDNLGSVEPI